MKPEAVRFEAFWGIEKRHAKPAQALFEAGKVVFVDAEAEMRQSLAGAFDDCAPAMAVTGRVYVNAVAAPFEIEPEFTIKCLGELHVRHNEIKSVERMDAKFSRTSRRADKASDLGHVISLHNLRCSLPL